MPLRDLVEPIVLQVVSPVYVGVSVNRYGRIVYTAPSAEPFGYLKVDIQILIFWSNFEIGFHYMKEQNGRGVLKMRRFLDLKVLVLFGLSTSAWGSFCPPDSAPLTPGLGQYTVACNTATGAKLCFETPAGACKYDNTVTVRVDGSLISKKTYRGTGTDDECTTSSANLASYLFSVGTHSVTTEETSPPDSSMFMVTVEPCTPSISWLIPSIWYFMK